ncbi:hypothetical protein TNCT_416511 [Trichonephila clavata]|uniref:Uncharacterized protein n=1 Tax=Trichonephila clavata TaxID=2740835 RepID=A0A8X6HGY8_TRICU|nr:hypothetical protein TNCT_416511 [Trichonephila clavata]
MLNKLRKNSSPPEKPNSTPPKPTSIAPKPLSTTTPKPPPQAYSKALTDSLPKNNPPPSQASSNAVGINTLQMFQDPDVNEMLQTLRTFLQISKSGKTKGQKFLEIAALLDLDLLA